MTSLHFSEVAAAIAALVVPGVNIKDLDDMQEKVDARDFPLLGPSSHEPAFFTDWEGLRISLAGNYQVSYTLNYVLFHSEFGAERSLFKKFPDLVSKAESVAEAFIALSDVEGCKSIKMVALPEFGPVHDATGTNYHGALFSFRVTEF